MTTLADPQLLVNYLDPASDEVAVVTAITERGDNSDRLLRASVVIGPRAIGAGNWRDWQDLHQLRPRAVAEPPGATYSVECDTLSTHRSVVSVDDAASWVDRLARSAGVPALSNIPALEPIELQAPTAPLRISRHLDSDAASFVQAAVRPGNGFLLRTGDRLTRSGDSTWWTDGVSRYINAPLSAGLPLLGDDCGGVVLSRLERRAWFNALRGGEDLATFDCHIGLEPDRIDVSDLQLTFDEWIDGELVVSQQVRLEDLVVDHVRGQTAFTVQLPTLGARVLRTLQLRDRTGTLLDRSSSRFGIVESIELTVNQIGVPGPGTEVVIGEHHPTPTYVERAEGIDRVRQQYQDLFASGAAATLLTPGADVDTVLAERLAQARGTLRIVDRYFGKDPAQWGLLRNVTVPVEVLTSYGKAPTTSGPSLSVRWHRGGRPPFHGRAYLWDGGGFAVDASPDAFGRDLVYITPIQPAVSDAWQAQFRAWWAIGSAS